jgi:phenylpropionate dioxygenase-like ring-hydroxylating dioxygenase large terminal subunit
MMKQVSLVSIVLLQVCIAFSPANHHDVPPKNGILQASVATVDVSTTSTDSSSASPFANFDYKAHWYPVVWAADLRLNEPTKVTVFDVDYVVAKISDTEVVALENRCPHKAAALSEGRVTSSGHFQCAYHGWSFNGTSGDCVEIPQIVQADGTMPPTVPSKSSAKAVPAQIYQEMVWLFPGGGLEEALQAPPPPSVREYEENGFKITQAVRDMPVDWPIVVSNGCDSDHGLFAHQDKGFDMYSASKDSPLQVTEEFPNDGKGWILKTQVDAREKLLVIDRNLRGDKPKPETMTPTAMFSLYAPFHFQLKRVTKDTNRTSLVVASYICPVGVGRTRLMSGGYSKKSPARWLAKLFFDKILEQDTYLLATQQQSILSKEAEDVRTMMEQQRLPSSSLETKAMTTRRNLFCLSSPTDKSGAKIENFFDATLLRVPNRVQTLLKLDAAGAFRQTPSREFVLDRKSHHLDVCPDSQDVVRNCERIIRGTNAFSLAFVAAKLLCSYWVKAQRWNAVLKPSALALIFGLSSVVKSIARRLKNEYSFKYTTDEMRRKDLRKIPEQIWLDK